MDRLTAMRAFVRLVELGTFSAVADDLRIKQSTVSKWVAALEDEMGVQLLNRTTRSIRITEAGVQFCANAKEILSAYEDARARLQDRSPELQGCLRVSLPVVFGTLFIVPWVPTFLKAHPKLELDLTFDDRYANLMSEDLDVLIRVGVAVDSTLKARTLGHSVRKVVASPSYWSEFGRPESPSALADHWGLRHSSALRADPWLFRKEDEVYRVPIRARFFANNSQALVTAAREGLGVALLADWLVDPHVAAGDLEVVLDSYETSPAPIQALTAPGRGSPARVRALHRRARPRLNHPRPVQVTRASARSQRVGPRLPLLACTPECASGISQARPPPALNSGPTGPVGSILKPSNRAVRATITAMTIDAISLGLMTGLLPTR